jgi:hypothetical protein
MIMSTTANNGYGESEKASRVTRFEVIDETGRIYVKYGVEVELSYQDDGRTLKVFVRSKGEAAEKQVRAEIVAGLVDFLTQRKV